MRKRRKIIKLFNEIDQFIKEEKLTCDPYVFLINKYYLAVNNKRSSASSLCNISKNEFSTISKRFEDRLKSSLFSSLSLSYIMSLPNESIIEIPQISIGRKKQVMVASPHIVLSPETEQSHTIHFGYNRPRTVVGCFFDNIQITPFPKNKPLNITLQSTLFDVIENEHAELKPASFDYIFDEVTASTEEPEALYSNLCTLSRTAGSVFLFHKKNYLRSSAAKKSKKELFSHFTINEINKLSDGTLLTLAHASLNHENVLIKSKKADTPFYVHSSDICFNNLLTFNDDMTEQEIALLKKIEQKSQHTCEDFFKFFIGMFPVHKNPPVIEKIRKNNRSKPFIRAQEVKPFNDPSNITWVTPSKEHFFQIPSTRNFESEKLLLRYLSVKPVFSHDNDKLYFMNDIAAIIPRNKNTLLEYAEGFLNSNVMTFYYMMRFPQHNKFLKKNFKKLPFFNCSLNIQRIISESVVKIRKLHQDLSVNSLLKSQLEDTIDREVKTLNNYVYQLFKLERDEIELIEQFHKESPTR